MKLRKNFAAEAQVFYIIPSRWGLENLRASVRKKDPTSSGAGGLFS